jgi:hypothetical protein
MNKLYVALFAFLFLTSVSKAQETIAPLTEAEGGFSYSPPKGWKISEVPGLKYKLSVGTPANGFAPNINVVDEAFSGTLDEYVEANLKTMEGVFKGFKKLGKTSFDTKSGLKGVRVVIEDNQQDKILRQTFYFFERKDGKKAVVTCSVLVEDGAKYTTVFDISMSTFSVSK